MHLRPMGSSQQNLWTGRVRWGFGQYFMGTAPEFMLASAVFRLPQHPAIYGSIAMLYGYVKSALKGAERLDDLVFRRFLRHYQRQCLVLGKPEATRRTNAAQAQVWSARHPSPPATG